MLDVDGLYLTMPGDSLWRTIAHQCRMRWCPSTKRWIAPLHSAHARLILDIVGPGDMSRLAAVRLAEAVERLDLLRGIRIEADAARGDAKVLHSLAAGFSWVTKPYAHQIHATLCAVAEPRWGLWMDTGTGKTKSALDAFRILRELGEVDRVLVVTPLHLIKRSWAVQVQQHTGLRCDLLLGTRARRVQLFEGAQRPIVITSYSTFSGADAKDNGYYTPFVQAFQDSGRWMIIYDEAHRIGAAGTWATKAAKAMSWAAARVLFLTATPMTGNLKRLFHLLLALNQGASFGSSWGRFVDLAEKYGLGYDAMGKPRWDRCVAFMEYVRTEFAKTGTQWELDDCVELPQRIVRDVRLDMVKEQRRLDSALKAFRSTTYQGEQTKEPDDAISNIVDRALLASGVWTDEFGHHRHLIDSPKRHALIDLLRDELKGSKVIVWCRFHAELDALSEILAKEKIRHGEYSGRVNHNERDRAVERFRTFGGFNVLLATPASFGEGHTLNEARAQVFYSLGYDWKDYKQALGRNYRIGQTHKTLVYRLICRGSIDEAIVLNLQSKRRLRDMVQ